MTNQKISIQITLNVEYDTISKSPEEMGKYLMRNVDYKLRTILVDDLLRNLGDDCEVSGWNLDVKQTDQIREQAQFRSEKITPFAHIIAYFSSDGPALVANIHGIPSGAASDAMDLTLSDINGALREAHQKYLANLRKG